MIDRPIIFSAPMVRALLDGSKTQTRRILTKTNTQFDGGKWPNWMPENSFLWDKSWIDAGPSPAGNLGPYLEMPVVSDALKPEDSTVHRIYPRTQPGDRLYVREAWRVGAWTTPRGKVEASADVAIDYLADSFVRREWLQGDDHDMMCRIVEQSRADAMKADLHSHKSTYEYQWAPGDSPCRKRPSTSMPRWASRLTLIVTDVRVQRLQEVSEADAWAEGCKQGDPNDIGGFFPAEQLSPDDKCMIGWDSARDWFADLWDSLGGPGAWEVNPWVVALTFTVHRSNIDRMGDMK